MGDYYKVAVTVPEPGSSPPPAARPKQPPGAPRPKHDPNEEPIIVQHPWQQQPPLQPSAPPPYTEVPPHKHQTLKPVPVKSGLRERCQSCERIIRRLLPLILLFFYTLLGGMIFHFAETRSQSDSDVAKGHRVLIDQPAAIQLQKKMEEIVLDSNFTREKRREEVRKALLWYLNELTVEEKARWDFASALFYSMTLYTTIGYGDTPPRTSLGKILTVIYSIIGIPLALVALIQLGYLIGWAVSLLWSCIRNGCSAARGRRRGGSRRSGEWQTLQSSDNDKREEQQQEAQEDVDLLSFPLSALIFLTIVWILITAALFYAWENDWAYSESLYFTFISFTTIGLGDYVPETVSGKLGGIFFLLVGLALLFTTLAVLQQQMEALHNAMKRSIDEEYQDSQGDVGEPMATDDKEMEGGLKKMASKLPPGSRLLFAAMPEGKKKNLRKYYAKKANMVPKAMQTDDYLWAMTTMSKSFLKSKLAEDKGGATNGWSSDEARSRDDVNSLVMMCDYSLPHDHASQRQNQ